MLCATVYNWIISSTLNLTRSLLAVQFVNRFCAVVPSNSALKTHGGTGGCHLIICPIPRLVSSFHEFNLSPDWLVYTLLPLLIFVCGNKNKNYIVYSYKSMPVMLKGTVMWFLRLVVFFREYLYEVRGRIFCE